MVRKLHLFVNLIEQKHCKFLYQILCYNSPKNVIDILDLGSYKLCTGT